MLGFYDELALYQITEPWPLKDVLRDLHCWKDRFNVAFKLNVSEIAIAVTPLSRSTLGHFRPGRNGFGLLGEIVVAKQHVVQNAVPDFWWEVLGTLLHEMLHAWQELHGAPSSGNYHNREFRLKASSLGLVIDKRGYTQYEPQSDFFRLLAEYNVTVPKLLGLQVTAKQPGRSKLKLWMCDCPIRVRVAVPHFDARCLRCGVKFKLQGSTEELA